MDLKYMKKTTLSRIGFAFCIALVAVLAGCAGYVDEPRRVTAYDQRPSRHEYGYAGVMARDEYVYYPGYQVYYNNNRRQYVYQDGNSWVTRQEPPHVAANVLRSSPSVKLDFHDSPATHHATVVQQYPKHWSQSGKKPNHTQGNQDEEQAHGRGNNRGYQS